MFSVRHDLLLFRPVSPVKGLRAVVAISKAECFSIEGQIYNVTIKT